jgi:glycosyltransferase involved in cell wall biosynthesis
MLSIVIPVHNEEPSILPLYDSLTKVLEGLERPYEIIFVDDASTDRSFELLANLVETDARLKVVRLRRNFGQTAALAAGFHEARGEVVVSMDGDLQHDPEDLPALLAKIDEGFDIASGWRKNRVDNALTRKLPSRIANWIMAKVSGSTCTTSAPPSRPTAPSSQGHPSVRRVAPVHPRAGQFLWRAHC